MIVGKTFTFDAAHRVLRHEGKCHNLHGHTYRLEIDLDGPVLESPRDVNGNDNPSYGMVLDFYELGRFWKEWLEPMVDHVVLLEDEDPLVERIEDLVKVTTLDTTPTAESLVYWIRDLLEGWLREENHGQIRVRRVRVYETPTSWAEG